MKINWGHSLVIFFVSYISFLVFTVYKSRTIDHSLVEENYYNYDINYQSRFDNIENRNTLANDLLVQYDKNKNVIELDFGGIKNTTGKIKFYRPSNSELDFTENFNLLKTSSYQYNTSDLASGKWKLKIDWNNTNKNYYKEETIYIR